MGQNAANLSRTPRLVVRSAWSQLEWRTLALVGPTAMLCLIVGPKLILTSDVNAKLHGDVHGLEWALVAAQDLLLFWVALGATIWCLPRLRRRHCTLLWAALGAFVLLLFIDMRVRQIWLKPLDFALVRYCFEQLAILTSSAEVFWTTEAGLGISSRRLLVVAAGIHFALGLSMLLVRRRHRARLRVITRSAARRMWVLVALVLAVGVLTCPRYIYSLQDALFVTQLSRALAAPVVRTTAEPVFEQPIRPAREALAAPRVRLVSAAPFRNLVIVVLESFRVRGVELERAPETPALRRLAQEGLHGKAYVTVPHSSKGLYAVLSGRAPSSGIVIREALAQHESSIVHDLRDLRGARTFAFSAPYLAFENMEGLLRAHGLDRVLGPGALSELSGAQGRNSYGTSDLALTTAPAKVLAAQRDRPFVAAILTNDAHHPYSYPGKPESEGDGFDAYRKALAHTDRVVDALVRSFEEARLLDDTLFVFVGDHGESFGEHGARVHNNSLYEEEIAVPLVFWSRDGRLRHAAPIEGRQIDIAPTVADLMGVDAPRFTTQGVSLLRARTRPPAFVASFFEGVSQALVLDGIKYMLWPSGSRLVRYDLRTDPAEQHPVAVTGRERDEVLARLAQARDYEHSVWAGRE